MPLTLMCTATDHSNCIFVASFPRMHDSPYSKKIIVIYLLGVGVGVCVEVTNVLAIIIIIIMPVHAMIIP